MIYFYEKSLKITYPDNKETNYIYENGYANKVNYNNTEILSNIEYEANNKAKRQVFANGLTDEENFDYEYGYRLVSKKAYLGENYYQNLNYTFDNVGNILNIADTSNLGIQKNVSYTYDDLNRLLSFNDGTKSINYTYDSIGNITNNSEVGEYSYENGINPQAVNQIGSGTILNYDLNGNVNNESINGINKSYTYNSNGELLSSQVNGITTNYLYDNNSNRVEKETGTFLNKYLNNDFEIETQNTLDGSGNTITQSKTSKYIYLGDKKIFTIENKDNAEIVVYNLSDHLGGGAVDVSQSGIVLQKSDYYPYGGSRILERNESYKNKYLFTGKELDDETNLQYFEVRYYNGDIGRFYGQDRVFWELGNSKRGIGVLADPQQLNSYSYARNNPLIYVDPSGDIVDTVWYVGNILYDAGRGIKNVGEIIGGGVAYGVGVYNNDEFLKEVAKNGIKSDLKDLGEVGVDAGTDSVAAMIPFVPAGSSKVARKADDVIDGSKSIVKYTSKEYSKMAQKLGYKEVKGQYSNGEKIFYNSKTKKYISGDNTQHNGGVWKMADSIKGLSGKETRSGTYDKDLKRIGD